jgi:predicted metal-dependent enzyme (double-stranded beta helix superfamily)
MSEDPAVAVQDEAFIEFVAACERCVKDTGNSIATRDAVARLAATLASHWRMPHAAFRQLQPGAPYSSYQLYLNAQGSLSVILDIFAPGQVAPVHNHRCWGVVACLEGEELERHYAVPDDLSSAPLECGLRRNGPGAVSVADPARHAFHQVECVGDIPAISLHIYGADLKALERERWDEDTAGFVTFTSGADPRRRQQAHYLSPEGLAAATS